MLDPFQREIDYLRLSVTDRCNLRCLYCMPAAGVKKKRHEDILPLETLEKIARTAVESGIRKIRLTGGEPLVRRGVLELISALGRLKSLGLRDLAMTTNGVLLASQAKDLKQAGLDRVNVSLDSLDAGKFRKITRQGELTDVLAGIRAAQAAGLTPVKINVVLLGGFNDEEIGDFVDLTRGEDLEVRFIELMPLGGSAQAPGGFLPATEVLRRCPRLTALPQPEHASVARLYRVPGGRGRVGLISPLSKHFCWQCDRIRLTPDGKLKSCLHTEEELDFRDYGETRIAEFLRDGVRGKPARHHMDEADFRPVARKMHEIGG